MKNKIGCTKWHIRKKLLGLMAVLGELYNRQMVNEKIIFTGLMSYILEKKDYTPIALDVEALCALLEQCSTRLSTGDRANKTAEIYLEKMVKIAEEMEPRIRSRVQEICDIKNNQWQNPRKLDKTKKSKDIHEDLQQQQGDEDDQETGRVTWIAKKRRDIFKKEQKKENESNGDDEKIVENRNGIGNIDGNGNEGQSSSRNGYTKIEGYIGGGKGDKREQEWPNSTTCGETQQTTL